MSSLVAQIKDEARAIGFEIVGITSTEELLRDDARFTEWREAGFAADMDYMKRRTHLHTRPAELAPAALSIITLAINYYASAPPFTHENRYGRVARYAWGRDYHLVVRPRLERLAERIEKLVGRKLRHRSFVDAVPLLERAVAARAGLGFFGKNTNLLLPQRGSWFFLAEILIELELPSEDQRVKISCGKCHRCLDACPTSAFAAPYTLDSRRCISYLTIENRGAIPRELRRGLGEWIFGCDICQEMRPAARSPLPVVTRGSESVCPFNRFAEDTTWPEFRPEAGAGPRLDLVEVLSIETDEQFRARFKGTPLTRPKRRGLLRNAAVVAANVGCTAAVSALAERIQSDSEPLIRSHALWAISRLDAQLAVNLALRVLKTDPDLSVCEEARFILDDSTSDH
ncbi:MAG: tRNA epoxyqueuosine(34) reductase QueG [Acidobacteriota bacterium]